MRGGIVDLYAPDMPKPCRIEFWGDEVDNIRTFDLVSQRREGAVKKSIFRLRARVLFGDTAETAARLRAAIGRAKGRGARQWSMPLRQTLPRWTRAPCPARWINTWACAMKSPALVLEYLSTRLCSFQNPAPSARRRAPLAFRFLAKRRPAGRGRAVRRADKFYEDGAALWQAAGEHSAVLCENFARTVPDVRLTATVNMPRSTAAMGGRSARWRKELEPLLAQKYAVCVLAGTRRAGEALARDLARAGLSAAFYAKLPQACPPGHVAVAAGSVTAGAEYPFARFALFTARQGAAAAPQKAKRAQKGLSSLSDIKPGDYVVHQNHGIGVYAGIRRLDLQGVVKDYLKIEYDKGDSLYVPVTQLDIVSRYTAPGDGERVKLAAGRRRMGQNQNARAQGHAGNGQRAD